MLKFAFLTGTRSNVCELGLRVTGTVLSSKRRINERSFKLHVCSTGERWLRSYKTARQPLFDVNRRTAS